MRRWWVLKGDPQKRHFVFTIAPDYRCQHDGIRYSVLDMNTGERTVTDARPAEEKVGITFTRWVSPAMQQAADALGMDGKKLAALITAAHRHGVERARVNDKLTELCSVCHAKMKNHGYYAYVECPVPEDEETETQRASRHIAERLGMLPPMKRLNGVTVATRKEAKQWAYDEYQIARRALEDQT